MQRLHMQNSTHFVEFANTHAGMMQAKAFRKSHPEFKRRRITEVLQLMPSSVPLGEIMRFTYR